MYKFISLIIFVILCNSSMYSQGFDWQYSTRMPSSSPILFAGLGFDYAYNYNNANIEFFENQPVCCIFNNGNGNQYSISITGEYWHKADIAYFAKIGFSKNSAIFKKQDSVPRMTSTFKTEYQFESTISYINLDLGIKYRLFNSHFHTDASLLISFLVSNNNTFKEKVIDPNDYFNTDPPTQERIIAEGKISKLNKVLFIPQISIGYDFTFARGMYSTLFIRTGLPIMNTITNNQWKIWNVNTGIIIYRGI